jgi:hypothetical protein
MKCPNCYSDIAPAPRCPRCDWPLQAAAAPAPSALFQEPSAWERPAAPEGDPWAAPGELAGGQQRAAANPAGWPAPGAPEPSLWGANPDAAPPQFGAPPGPSAGLPQLPFGPPSGAESVPLTASQKRRLMVELGSAALPFLLMVGFFFLAMGGSAGKSPMFLLIFVTIALFVGYNALQALRDLRSGVALAQVARLTRSWRRRGKSTTYYYGEFEGLGELKLSSALYSQVQAGAVYRVTYSPASKVAWSADPYAYGQG